LGIGAAGTDCKHTQDPQFLLERTALEEVGKLMVVAARRRLKSRFLDLSVSGFCGSVHRGHFGSQMAHKMPAGMAPF
jgi:hypothetical protein